MWLMMANVVVMCAETHGELGEPSEYGKIGESSSSVPQ